LKIKSFTQKNAGDTKCIPFFSTSSVPKNLCSDKYLVNYTKGIIRNVYGSLHVKCQS